MSALRNKKLLRQNFPHKISSKNLSVKVIHNHNEEANEG